MGSALKVVFIYRDLDCRWYFKLEDKAVLWAIGCGGRFKTQMQ